MDEKIIEAVARAIAQDFGVNYDLYPKTYLSSARAAIEAYEAKKKKDIVPYMKATSMEKAELERAFHSGLF